MTKKPKQNPLPDAIRPEPPQAPMTCVAIEGWLLGHTGDKEPRIRDLDLGERLGYERPRKIRELIERMIQEGKLPGIHVRPAVGRTSMPNGGEREVPVKEYWLTEEEALLVATQSEAPLAWALTREIVRVFRAALRGLLPGQAPPLTHDACIAFLVNEAMGHGYKDIARRHIALSELTAKRQMMLLDVGPAVVAPGLCDEKVLAVLGAAPEGIANMDGVLVLVGGRRSEARASLWRHINEGRVTRTHNGKAAIYKLRAVAA